MTVPLEGTFKRIPEWYMHILGRVAPRANVPSGLSRRAGWPIARSALLAASEGRQLRGRKVVPHRHARRGEGVVDGASAIRPARDPSEHAAAGMAIDSLIRLALSHAPASASARASIARTA